MTVLALTDQHRDVSDAHPRPDSVGYVERQDDGLSRMSLLIEGAHCGACVRRIEDALAAADGIVRARLNLSTRRLELAWRGTVDRADELVGIVEGLGYEATPYLPEAMGDSDNARERRLLKALAVAFFALSNVMMLSWAVWSGHDGGMQAATRSLFHWLSALVALPAIAYAGWHFFTSAASVLRRGHTNMDVPISLGVLLTTGMSLFETMRGGPHVYFDGALSLLFVLLVGRYLDQQARSSARSAVKRLTQLNGKPVQLISESGAIEARPPSQIRPGQLILVAAGETVGVDGIVTDGVSGIDKSLIDGETRPSRVAPGQRVFAGTINLDQPLIVRALAAGQDTVLAEMVRLIEAAEQKKGRFVSLADRVVRYYTPVIHALAAATFLGWVVIGDAGWQIALVYAVSVLIIACPCALGLAVPVTQVVAAGALMRRGILLKSETALERLARIDTVLFDKTGTLTLGRPTLVETDAVQHRDALVLASGLAASSGHPLARALRRAAPEALILKGVREEPGCGLFWQSPKGDVRLGAAEWCGAAEAKEGATTQPSVWFARPGDPPLRFRFHDALRHDVPAVLDELRRKGYGLGILSGDRGEAVAALAIQLGVSAKPDMKPAEKLAEIEAIERSGHHVLMVGDGLNDAPALAAAHASLAPATALDISRHAADAVWQGSGLRAVPILLDVARRARAIVLQNIAFSFLYNAAWVPVAMAGLVTPWMAALAMSASSLLVTLNALRLGRRRAGDV